MSSRISKPAIADKFRPDLADLPGPTDTTGWILGTEASELIRGHHGNDSIAGYGGDDTLSGGADDDFLHGGAGSDNLRGRSGNDSLWGSDGNDTLQGGGGANFFYDPFGDNLVLDFQPDDTIVVTSGASYDVTADGNDSLVTIISAGGEQGTLRLLGVDPTALTTDSFLTLATTDQDSVIGTAKDDLLQASSDDDLLKGFKGDDLAFAEAGDDTVHADQGDDTIFGGSGSDVLYGGIDDDYLDSGTGEDTLYGGDGDDVLVGNAGSTIVGGEGMDSADFSGVNLSLFLKLMGPAASASAPVPAARGPKGPPLSTLENVIGGGAGDTIIGNAEANKLDGLSGDDRISGRAGADTISGGSGNDIFAYQSLRHSTLSASDLIVDLEQGDTIDLSKIDANKLQEGDQAFMLVSQFTSNAGQMSFRFDNAGMEITYLDFDVDGDAVADGTIRLTGDHSDFTNFIL